MRVIERLFLRDYLGFERVELEFAPSLVVFTGPSGAGKSLLLEAILALFGHRSVQAKVSQIDLVGDFGLESFGFLQEEVTSIRAIKREKVRYFLNSQTISKRTLKELFAPHLHYLFQKDHTFFSSANLLQLVESCIEIPEYWQVRERYDKLYARIQELQERLEQVRALASRHEELREFLEFEIAKIEAIDPKEGEYEELLNLKRDLSRKERLLEAIQRAQGIFEYEGAVGEALELMGHGGELFNQAMEELRELFAREEERLQELESVDIAKLLERLEALSSLKRRYGSIEGALQAKEEKRQELARLQGIRSEERAIERELSQVHKELRQLADQLHRYRLEGAQKLQERVNGYLAPLHLPSVTITCHFKALEKMGGDRIEVQLAGVPMERISSGEYNRLRLAFMAASGRGSGILILDEIDANISGEESMAVAKILKSLAQRYQILAISHQAQLASQADQHFLVRRVGTASIVQELRGQERIEEIARIVSGPEITREAREFAKKLLKESS
ncbi:MAG: hypothetical protein C6I00_02495 [Nitratiruptor sp.]|nr:hypothetical protein [Nitratiruptor sp.]NPA84155.1 AAA family ATPase [Campylobacterota bacterium]